MRRTISNDRDNCRGRLLLRSHLDHDGKQMTAGQSFMTMVVTGTPNRRSAR